MIAQPLAKQLAREVGGHSPLGGLLIGSVTQRLLHIAPCAVLALPSHRHDASLSPPHSYDAT